MENQKKVLFVATVATHIRSFHTPYLKMLKDNGYKVYVAANNNLNSGEIIEYCDEFIQLCIERKPLCFNNIKALLSLKKIIDKEKFDIVHCHTPMGAVLTRLAACKSRKKYVTRVIYTAHGFHFFKDAPIKNWLLFYPIEWFLSKKTDTLVTINKEDYVFADKKFSNRCMDIKYVPGVGIDISRFNITLSSNEKKIIRNSLGLGSNDIVLTCVARLDKNKNQGFLISVMEELVKENNSIHLLLAGKDELNGFYQRLAKSKHLENNVHFLGNRNDIPELLSISDVILSASKREGLPVNVIEAFACGKPVVALECRGMSDLISNGISGYIIKQGDYNSFIEAVNKIINSKVIINKMKANNIKESNKYSIDKILSYFNKIYLIDTKIPKIIHYVWMGGKSKPNNIIKCMKSWSKLNGYEIKEWNESNFPIDKHPFCKKAYENKKWAFVSDYVRAWAIYNYGGIYFDTDILVIDGKRLDSMLVHEAFVGYESKLMPFTAVFGAVKGHKFIKKMLDHYDNNIIDINIPNTQWVSELLIKEYGCILGNIEQDLTDNLHVYPKEILCEPSNKSVTVHAFTGTWVNKKSIFGTISTFLRVNSNHKICRFIYSRIIIPVKERKNERIYNSNNSNL